MNISYRSHGERKQKPATMEFVIGWLSDRLPDMQIHIVNAVDKSSSSWFRTSAAKVTTETWFCCRFGCFFY
jgi:hypothetical protein